MVYPTRVSVQLRLTHAVTEPSHIPRSVGVQFEFRVRSVRNILTEQNYNSSG